MSTTRPGTMLVASFVAGVVTAAASFLLLHYWRQGCFKDRHVGFVTRCDAIEHPWFGWGIATLVVGTMVATALATLGIAEGLVNRRATRVSPAAPNRTDQV